MGEAHLNFAFFIPEFPSCFSIKKAYNPQRISPFKGRLLEEGDMAVPILIVEKKRRFVGPFTRSGLYFTLQEEIVYER